ncbi:uncharacterized protein [Argopecten irradians]|uniref:uncharacterized protein n=1 Tax=Argopecten irradians TaxID=31199 RepID=UPI00371F79C5
MEHIMIPDISRIARLTRKTIDRFVSMTEAISDTKEEIRCFVNTSKFAVCRAVMMELSRKTLDFDGLFDILEKVTLALVSDGLPYPCVTRELPNLTRQQQDDLLKFRTFNKVTVKELKQKITLLRLLIKKHKQIMATYDKYTQVSIKCEKKLTAIMYRLHGPTTIKPKVMSSLLKKRDQAQKAFDKARTALRVQSEVEQKIRARIKITSDDIVSSITNQIVDRLDYGIERCLYDIIDSMTQPEIHQRMVKLVQHINKYEMADRVVRQYSDTYGMRVIVQPRNVKNDVSISDISSSAESIGDSAIVEELHSSSAETSQGPSSGGASSSGEISHDTGYSTGTVNDKNDSNKHVTVLMKRKVKEVKIQVKVDSDRWLPGFIDIKKGMEIQQTVRGEDEEIAFGYYRSSKKSQKQWGFYFVNPTLSLMELLDCRARK